MQLAFLAEACSSALSLQLCQSIFSNSRPLLKSFAPLFLRPLCLLFQQELPCHQKLLHCMHRVGVVVGNIARSQLRWAVLDLVLQCHVVPLPKPQVPVTCGFARIMPSTDSAQGLSAVSTCCCPRITYCHLKSLPSILHLFGTVPPK